MRRDVASFAWRALGGGARRGSRRCPGLAGTCSARLASLSSRRPLQIAPGNLHGGWQRALTTASGEGIPRRAASATKTCWNCQQETSQTSLLCENQQCAAIQPVGKDVTYYDVLVGGPPTFDIDTAQLRRNFLRLQQAAHPDSFSQREDIERKLAEAQSAWINHAYSTLLDPLQRAHYLLRLGGREIGEEDQVTDPELLMEVMESRTDIEDAKTEEQVGELGRRNNEKMAQTVESLAQAFRENRLDDAHRQTSRLQYLRRVAQAIRDWEP